MTDPVEVLITLPFPENIIAPLGEVSPRLAITIHKAKGADEIPPEQWEKMIKLSIHDNLTSDEVAQYIDKTPVSSPSKPKSPKSAKQPGKLGTGGIRRFYNAVYNLDEVSRDQALDEIADDIFISGQAKELLELMNELSKLIKVRLKSK